MLGFRGKWNGDINYESVGSLAAGTTNRRMYLRINSAAGGGIPYTYPTPDNGKIPYQTFKDVNPTPELFINTAYVLANAEAARIGVLRQGGQVTIQQIASGGASWANPVSRKMMVRIYRPDLLMGLLMGENYTPTDANNAGVISTNELKKFISLQALHLSISPITDIDYLPQTLRYLYLQSLYKLASVKATFPESLERLHLASAFPTFFTYTYNERIRPLNKLTHLVISGAVDIASDFDLRGKLDLQVLIFSGLKFNDLYFPEQVTNLRYLEMGSTGSAAKPVPFPEHIFSAPTLTQFRANMAVFDRVIPNNLSTNADTVVLGANKLTGNIALSVDYPNLVLYNNISGSTNPNNHPSIDISGLKWLTSLSINGCSTSSLTLPVPANPATSININLSNNQLTNAIIPQLNLFGRIAILTLGNTSAQGQQAGVGLGANVDLSACTNFTTTLSINNCKLEGSLTIAQQDVINELNIHNNPLLTSINYISPNLSIFRLSDCNIGQEGLPLPAFTKLSILTIGAGSGGLGQNGKTVHTVDLSANRVNMITLAINDVNLQNFTLPNLAGYSITNIRLQSNPLLSTIANLNNVTITGAFQANNCAFNMAFPLGTVIRGAEIYLHNNAMSLLNIRATMVNLWTNRNAFNNASTTAKVLNISHEVITTKTLLQPSGYVLGGDDTLISFSDDDLTAIREISFVLFSQQISASNTTKRYRWSITL